MFQNRNYYTLVLALLGGLKLALEAFGIKVDNGSSDAIVNGVAAIFTIGGIVMTHIKALKSPAAQKVVPVEVLSPAATVSLTGDATPTAAPKAE